MCVYIYIVLEIPSSTHLLFSSISLNTQELYWAFKDSLEKSLF